MTLAIDFLSTSLGSGTKSYNINFCKELDKLKLEENIIIFLSKDYYKEIIKNNPKNSKLKYIIKPNYLANIFFRLIWMQFIFPFELKFYGVKKVFCPMNFSPLFLKFFNIKVILGLHSNLPWVYFNYMPGNFFRKYLTKKLMELSIYSCNILIVNSNFARNEIVNLLNINKNKVYVCYLGLDKKYLENKKEQSFVSGLDYKKSYILSVLSCVKYHNIINLLKAYKQLSFEIKDLPNFYIVAQILDKNYFNHLNQYIKDNFDNKSVIIVSKLSSNYLINLYRNAKLYIFTSYCEVFGLTTLEAMSQGCPVLVSNFSALPEINDTAAEYFHPDKIEEIKTKIQEIIFNENKIQHLKKKGFDRIKFFSWEKNVNKTIDIIYNLNTD